MLIKLRLVYIDIKYLPLYVMRFILKTIRWVKGSQHYRDCSEEWHEQALELLTQRVHSARLINHSLFTFLHDH